MGLIMFFFFFKQKTAYEMRISDWSSDVCSSDLSARTALVRRDIFLATVFLWRTPLDAPRIISGWAAFSASAASSLLPAVIADSTFLTKVRIRLTRDLLTSARRSFRRVRFLALCVFAIGKT